MWAPVIFAVNSGLFVVMGLLAGGVFVLWRWTPPDSDRGWWWRWRLDIGPRVGYGVYVVMAVLGCVTLKLLATLWLFGLLVLAPVAVWTSLWASRRWPGSRSWSLTWPVWELVDLRLCRLRRAAEENRDHWRQHAAIHPSPGSRARSVELPE